MTNWKREIRIKQFFEEENDLETVRERTIAVLRAQPEYDIDSPAFDEEYNMLVDEMAEVDTVRYFDLCLTALYDWADDNLIWIGGEFPSRRLPSET